MSYYADVNGKTYKLSWVAYEKLKLMGWVHRILDEKQAVLHYIGK